MKNISISLFWVKGNTQIQPREGCMAASRFLRALSYDIKPTNQNSWPSLVTTCMYLSEGFHLFAQGFTVLNCSSCITTYGTIQKTQFFFLKNNRISQSKNKTTRQIIVNDFFFSYLLITRKQSDFSVNNKIYKLLQLSCKLFLVIKNIIFNNELQSIHREFIIKKGQFLIQKIHFFNYLKKITVFS